MSFGVPAGQPRMEVRLVIKEAVRSEIISTFAKDGPGLEKSLTEKNGCGLWEP